MSEDLSKIAEDLAVKSVSVRDYNRTVKAAAPEWLSSLGDYASKAYNSVASNPTVGRVGQYLNDNPMLAKTLAGVGIGGALGGASSLFADRDSRNTPRSILHGALAGGGLGLGAGLVGRYGGDSINKGLNYVRQRLGMPITGAINAAKGPETSEILSAINAYQTPKFTEGLSKAYLNPVMAGVLGVDAGTNLLGAAAAAGRNGRLNTQEPVLQALWDKIVAEPKVLSGKTKGDAFIAKVNQIGGSPTDQLRRILNGRDLPFTYTEKAIVNSAPGATPKGGLPVKGSVTKAQLQALMQDIPGAKHYSGGIGALGNLMERAGQGNPNAAGRLASVKSWLRDTGRKLQNVSTDVGTGSAAIQPSRLARLLTFREHASPMFGVSARSRALARLGAYGGLPLLAHSVSKMREAGANKQNLLKLLEAYKNSGGDASQISPEVLQAINGVA